MIPDLEIRKMTESLHGGDEPPWRSGFGRSCRRNNRAMRITALVLLLGAAFSGPARAGETGPEASAAKPAVVNAWVVDIPSRATVTKIEGVIVILNPVEKKYELLEEGRALEFDDIIRMITEGRLKVRYEDGSEGTFDYRDYPEDPDAPGTWLVFKERQ